MEAAIGSQEVGTQPEDWMLEERFGTKRAEEKATAGGDGDGEMGVVKRPKAARKIVGEGKAKPAGARRTKLVLVKQEYIEALMARPPKPYVGLSDERIDKILDPELREQIRSVFGRGAAMMKAVRDKEADILEQYLAKGYAEEEIEVRDGEEMEQ